MPESTRIFFGVAALLVVIGLVIWKAPGLFQWFGRLPGDIRHEGEHSRVLFPLVSMLIVSAVLTVAVNIVVWITRAFRG
jgi:hypothetical protein